MTKKTTITALTLALCLAMATFAFAGPFGQGGRGMGMGPGAGYTQLTPEQQAQWQKDHAAYLTATEQLRTQMATKRVQMRTLMGQPNVDTAKCQALANEMIDLRAQLAKARVKFMGKYGVSFGPGSGFGPGKGGPGFGRHGRGGAPCWR